jgi:thiamine biosynthesis lipoprotein
MPADHFSSVTIVTEDSGWADYLSTLLFVLPYDEGVIFAEENPDVDVLWVFSDGQTQMTDGMASRLKSMGAVPD